VTAPTGPGWYDVLDVEPTATTDEIRAAWRSAIADLTPAYRRFRLYNQAAEVLLDEEQRAAYDAELAAAAPEPEPEPDAEPDPEPDAEPDAEVVDPVQVEPRPWPARPTEPPALPRPAARLVPTWLIVALALLAAAGVGLTGYLWQQPSEDSVESAVGTARAAAERAVVPLLSYDYQSLDADQQAAHDVITSGYASRDYDDLFEVIRENAPTTQTVVDVEVIASAVVRAGEDRSEILLFVNRPTTNKATTEPVVYKDQVTLTMERVGDEWLVDDLKTSPIGQ
jgi:Mce-associated membrane protein